MEYPADPIQIRPGEAGRLIARLPYTVTTTVEPGQRYDFTVPEHELKFFDATTGLRTAPRPL